MYSGFPLASMEQKAAENKVSLSNAVGGVPGGLSRSTLAGEMITLVGITYKLTLT